MPDKSKKRKKETQVPASARLKVHLSDAHARAKDGGPEAKTSLPASNMSTSLFIATKRSRKSTSSSHSGTGLFSVRPRFVSARVHAQARASLRMTWCMASRRRLPSHHHSRHRPTRPRARILDMAHLLPQIHGQSLLGYRAQQPPQLTRLGRTHLRREPRTSGPNGGDIDAFGKGKGKGKDAGPLPPLDCYSCSGKGHPQRLCPTPPEMADRPGAEICTN